MTDLPEALPDDLPQALAEKAQAATALLRAAAGLGPAALASSLSAEDMVLTDLIVRAGLPIGIFTLDTGRLAPETVAMIDATEQHFAVPVTVYRPVAAAVDAYVAAHGRDAFYESVELRKACCGIRKVEPLKRALAGKAAWITGQRRGQGVTRTDLAVREHDAAHGLEKFNPLADWTWEEVLSYVAARAVPVNPLHARGYPSIGCDPCTRAIRPGEDPRAGRWWWENSDSKECGLHVSALPRTTLIGARP
ncbi:MAG: phosphoadenylyl-sulfate reductase [Hyphomonadaceae bacterium]|nr:phosphoadenylyl-sulfate reductase [Hyphomonadaceae bacterium]